MGLTFVHAKVFQRTKRESLGVFQMVQQSTRSRDLYYKLAVFPNAGERETHHNMWLFA